MLKIKNKCRSRKKKTANIPTIRDCPGPPYESLRLNILSTTSKRIQIKRHVPRGSLYTERQKRERDSDYHQTKYKLINDGYKFIALRADISQVPH